MRLLKLLQFLSRDSPASADTNCANAARSAKCANRLRGQLEMRRGLFRREEDLTNWLSAAIAWGWLFHCLIPEPLWMRSCAGAGAWRANAPCVSIPVADRNSEALHVLDDYEDRGVSRRSSSQPTSSCANRTPPANHGSTCIKEIRIDTHAIERAAPFGFTVLNDQATGKFTLLRFRVTGIFNPHPHEFADRFDFVRSWVINRGQRDRKILPHRRVIHADDRNVVRHLQAEFGCGAHDAHGRHVIMSDDCGGPPVAATFQRSWAAAFASAIV